MMMTTMRFSRAILAAAAAAAILAGPAHAQQGGQSDVSGPIVTGSGGTGGTYQGAGLRVLHPVFMELDGHIFFASRDVGCAVRATVDDLRRRKDRGELHPRLAPRGDAAAATAAVWALLDATGDAGRAEDRVRRALLPPGTEGGDYERKVDELLRRIRGLYVDAGECPLDPRNRAEAERWAQAFDAFDDLLDAMPDAVLAARPAELLALHAALAPVLEEAIRVGRRADRRGRSLP